MTVFTTAVVGDVRLVRATLPTVLVQHLAMFAAHGVGRQSREELTARGPLASAGAHEDDMFARLEADMAGDRLIEQLLEASNLAERATVRILGAAATADPTSPLHGQSRLQFGTADGELFLQWLHMVSLHLRQQEMRAAGVEPPRVGQPQDAGALFGADLDDLAGGQLTDTDAQADPQAGQRVEMQEITLGTVLMVLVHDLQQAVFTDQLDQLAATEGEDRS